jgi:hypothetical protein
MAVMGRRKRAVARGWEATNKQRDEEHKKNREEAKSKEKKVSDEEHAKKVKILKEMGLIK